MFDRLLGFDYTLWIAAFAFYAIDVCLLARADEVLFVEAWGRLRPVLSRVPFTFRGADLYWLAPIAPFAAVFRARCGAASLRPAAEETAGAVTATAVATPAIGELRRHLRPYRWTGTLVFVLLFVAGPVLTWQRGLGAALLLVLPPAYVVALAGIAWLLVQAEPVGLTRRAALVIGFDCLVCIPYAANLAKRIARRYDGAGQAEAWMQAYASAEEAERIRAILAEREREA